MFGWGVVVLWGKGRGKGDGDMPDTLDAGEEGLGGWLARCCLQLMQTVLVVGSSCGGKVTDTDGWLAGWVAVHQDPVCVCTHVHVCVLLLLLLLCR